MTFWHVHRRVVRASGGRKGLWPPRPDKWGALRLTTTGRRSGEARSVIVGYSEDGPNLVKMAMNGWGVPELAWWLNLQATRGGCPNRLILSTPRSESALG